MKRTLLSLFIFSLAHLAFSQATIKGTLVDDATNEPLIGASILKKGTSEGTITDIDGTFSLEISENTGSLVMSYLGYSKMNIAIDGSTSMYDLGTLSMESSSVGLEEVVITGVMDIVRDRRTPVAVSTIGQAEILAKGGNIEFPELMKSTPSIYVAGQAGGYGDSEVFTRGFDQTNTAFLLNGQPINGMEDGKMYWSNWSGMTDVATAVQVQRGLGSSKLAISSVGGTTNIIMKSTEQEQGGSVSYLMGNDAYNKITASYNTGMINDKFGLTVLLTHWQGNGWAEGTKGQGQNYFISAGYKASEKSQFNFLLTGAPQWHDQNFDDNISDHYDDNGDFNIKYNGNWGTLDGEHFTSRRNYYHKPVANLNWDLTLNEKSKLSTVLYGSWGRGGGSGGIGNSANRKFTSDGQWDFDAIVAANQASNGTDGNEYVLRNSVNNHSWFGLVTNYETLLSQDLTLAIGADLRSYRGSHFREVRDLLGANAYSQRENARFPAREVTSEFTANPWSGVSSYADLNERIAYNNDETIGYAGIFGQLEYSKNALSGYVQTAVSNQSHVRFELFNETESSEASEKVSNLGYNFKTGFSLELNENSNFFINTGYYQRQPFHDNIYLNFSNFVNPVTVPEKIFGLEAGYKYASKDFAINVNVYRTSWKDRASTNTLREGDVLPNGVVVGTQDVFQNAIQDQLHTGLEIDFSYDMSDAFRIKGFGSFGNWQYNGDIRSQYFDDNRELILENTGDAIDGVKVGGAAQTTFGLGADYKVSSAFKIDLSYNHYANLYSRVSADRGELKLPSFGLFDLGVSYRVNLDGGKLLTFRTNVYNLLGTEYISRATSTNPASSTESENWKGVNKSNRVQFGKTRTWNVSARYSF
ncbi:MAG: iron complex outermembrane receptor protein [Saprospiraceae bacterium]|jgi:iron complex outermembrane receptor protein